MKKQLRGRISIFRFMYNFPVGETPAGGGFYRRVSSPACEKLKYAQLRFIFIPRLPLLCTILLYAQVSAAQFRASVVKKDITPADAQMLLGYDARRSTGVHDHIFRRIVALDGGNTQFFLVSSDICEISPSLYDEVAAALYARFKIKPLHFWWTVTHTHSAPELGSPGLEIAFLGERYQHTIDSNYLALVVQKLIEGIAEAREKLAPARLGTGWGFSQANINRRAIDTDGKASLGLNPDGPVDRRIGLLRLDKADGSPLALIANYPVHGTVLGKKSLEISGDVPGIVSEYVEQKTGAPMLFINGAAGDLAPIYSVYPDPVSGHLNQFKVLLGDKIIEANKKITSAVNKIRIIARSLTVETPRKPGLGWADELAKYTTTKAGVNMVRLPVYFLKLTDDIAIWSAPIELFCEVASKIRDRSPFPFTFYFGYSNGWLGYLPSEDQWEHGGYEVNTASPYTPSAERDLTAPVISYLQGELRSNAIVDNE